jgi:hypothetical protein
MMKETVLRIAVSVALSAFILACTAVTEYWRPPALHIQEEGENLRFCLDCHEETEGDFPYKRFVHTMLFSENHKHIANQHHQICAMCHQPSYCDECHGVRVELKPSLKNQIRTGRRMPHRGDYLSRHKIDGRVDPISCLRCHGNPKTTKTCKPCHGQ